jgi:hypothetical protein
MHRRLALRLAHLAAGTIAIAAARPGRAERVAPAPAPTPTPAPTATDDPGLAALAAPLHRERASTEAARRAILVDLGAEVPDAQGRFETPKRDPEEKDPESELHWLAELTERAPPGAAKDDLVTDVETLRALAATRRPAAAALLLEFAFSPAGLIYRDECGRSLRQMTPYALPALIRETQGDSKSARARYARYQLERLDRENPAKAFADAPDEDLAVAILTAYGDVHHPDAIFLLLEAIDDPSPRIRAVARTAWLGYVTGEPPPPAPRQRLVLPGGRLTHEPQPLWLTYREHATIELARALEAVTGEKPARRASLAAQSEQLFAFYDGRRDAARAARFTAAAALAEAERFAEAAAEYDAILVEDAEFAQRAAMAPGYVGLARGLQKQKRWDDAQVAYAKARGVAPDGPLAREAGAGHTYARARVVAAGGGDPRADLERTLALAPDHAGARKLLAGADPDVVDEARPRWMLYGGAGGASLALFLLVWAWRKRGS